MGDFWNMIGRLPIANLFILAGILFLLIAAMGSFRNYFNAGKWGRIASIAFGGVLLAIGLGIYIASALISKLAHFIR
jgi:hypothetical protein